MQSLVALSLALVGVLLSPDLARAADSTQYVPRSAPVYAASWAGVQNGAGTGVTAGHVGMDFWENRSGLNGGQDYLPCQNPSDSQYASCPGRPTGYYKVLLYCWPPTQQWDGQVGVDPPFQQESAGFALEIYPYSDTSDRTCGNNWANWPNGYDLQPGGGKTVYGGLRVVVNSRAPDIGLISTPQSGDPGTGSINGYICHSGANQPPSCPNGNPAPDGSVNMAWFGQATATNRSSAGYPVASFAAWHNQSSDTSQPSSNSGYYTSGPLLDGTTVLFLAGHRCVVNVGGYGGRLDFNLDDAWLGHQGMCA